MSTREGYRWFRGGWRPSPAQQRVLDQLAAGRTNAEIAMMLGLSAETVKWHIAQLLAQTGCADRTDLARWADRRERGPLLLPLLYGIGRAAAMVAALAVGVLLLVAGGAAVRRVATSLSERPAPVALDLLPIPTSTPSPSPGQPLPPAVRVDAEIAVGYQPFYLAVGEGAVWVPIRGEGTLLRIDPQTNTPVATIPIGDPARGGSFGSAPNPGTAASVVVTNGFVWVTKEDERALAQVDPRTNAVVAIIPLGVVPHALAVGHGAIWVTSREGTAEDAVLRVDLTTHQVVATIPMGTPNGIAVVEEAVWVGNGRQDTVTRIDPRTNQVATVIRIPGQGTHPGAASACVWAPPTPARCGSGKRHRTARWSYASTRPRTRSWPPSPLRQTRSTVHWTHAASGSSTSRARW